MSLKRDRPAGEGSAGRSLLHVRMETGPLSAAIAVCFSPQLEYFENSPKSPLLKGKIKHKQRLEQSKLIDLGGLSPRGLSLNLCWLYLGHLLHLLYLYSRYLQLRLLGSAQREQLR